MRIRFLMFGWGNASGGIRSVVNQANALADRHEVELVAVFKRKKVPFPLDPRIKCRVLKPRNRIKRWLYRQLAKRPSRYVPRTENRYADFSMATDLMLRRYVSGLRDGVLISTRPALNVVSARFGSPSVVRIGEDHMNFRSYQPELAAVMRRWYPQLSAVTVLTRPDAAEYVAGLGSRARVEHMPNMVPAAAEPPAPLENKVVVAAGRLTHQKGFDMLIDAFAPVARAHPDWRLRIFGNGRLHAKLTARIASLGMTDNITLEGCTNRFEAELRDASLYVLSSRYEGLPMTILEAMTQGLPVVAYDCHTGPGDVITDGNDGLLVPPGDTAALTAAITDLVEDRDKLRKLGANAYESVRQFYAESIGPRWERLFDDLGAR